MSMLLGRGVGYQVGIPTGQTELYDTVPYSGPPSNGSFRGVS